MRIVFFILQFFFATTLLLSQFSFPGTGSEDVPYQLWTKDHWNELSDYSHNYFWTNGSGWPADKKFQLANDIDVLSKYLLVYFDGHFQGNGKIMTVNMCDYSPFSSLYSGNSSTVIGGINDLTISGNIFTVDIDATSFAGIVGVIYYDGSVSNCITNVNLECYDYGSQYGYFRNGGITVSNQGTISHCINNGSVTGVDFVAGIAAESRQGGGKIFNCINTGRITATSTEIKNRWNYTGAGGICVNAPGRDWLKCCINLGDVEGSAYVGGIAVRAVGNFNDPKEVISDCINAGFVRGKKCVGGIISLFVNGPFLRNCINTGIVEGEEDSGNMLGKEE